jgi:16S rRNA (adenine1518-N6/adenine1519-N6)-dimethyltransferase
VSQDPAPTPNPPSLTQLRAVFRQHGFHPRRSLGQTFLIDGNIVRNIVAAADLTGGESVLELGAGAGAVTSELAHAARRVVAVELDSTLVAILHDVVGDAAEIVQADMLSLDWADLFGPADRGRWRVVANLPYAITGPALFRLAEVRQWASRLVIMVQEEVGERLVASPGGRARGILSVLLQALFDITIVARVSQTCFYPRPKVDSMILVMDVRSPAVLSPALEPAFRRVVRAAFGTRRKTLANALAAAPELAISKADAIAALSHSAIDPRRRAESLSEEEFLRLAEAISGPREGCA